MRKIITWVMWTPRRSLAVAVLLVFSASVGFAVIRDANADRQYRADLAQYEEDLAAFQSQQASLASESAREAREEARADTEDNRADVPSTVPTSVPPGPDVPLSDGTDDILQAGTTTGDGVDVALEFAGVFYAASTYDDVDQWVDDLTPLVAPALVPYLQQTPLDAVPPAPAGDPVTEESGFTAVAEWDLGRDVFRVTTADTGDGWVVVDYDLTPSG